MYINDVHIAAYIIIFIIGALVGQSINWVNKRVIDNKKVFSREILGEMKKKINYITILIMAVLYIIVLFKFGISKEFLNNLDLIKYLILIPILVSIIMIDYKNKIIPNRLVLTIFEGGVIFTFLYALNSLIVARDYLIAMILGGLIFSIIAILGRIIAGKEAMGMGDIKLMTVLGLYFGISLTVSISILSFIIAAIFSIIMIILKKKQGKKFKFDEYITFGPYICIAAILCIILPKQAIISVLLTVFTLGRV